jgi:DNA-binding MarR family transcriptional regulator
MGLNGMHAVGKAIRMLDNMIMRRFDRNRPDRVVLERATGTNRWVIGYLVEQQRAGRTVYQRDLEAVLGITRSTVSRVLDLMERKGLVERQPEAGDARLRRLVLTERAMALHEKMRAYAEGFERELTAGFSPEEIDSLMDYLDRIRRNLEN